MTTTEVPVKAEFSVAVGAMADALAHCAAATMTPGTGPLPILSHVALRVASGYVTLFATDLEWGVTARMPAPHCEGDWSAAIPAGRTAQLLKKFKPTEVVTFTRSPIHGPIIEVLVECGRSKTRLKAIEDESFPEPPQPGPLPLYTVRGNFLAQSLGLVRPFTVRGHERQILGGVAIGMNEHGVGYQATTTQIVADFVDEGAFFPGTEFPTEAVTLPAAVCKQIELAAEACGEDIVRVYPAGLIASPRALIIECPASAPVEDDVEDDAVTFVHDPTLDNDLVLAPTEVTEVTEVTDTSDARVTHPRTTSVTIFARAMEGVYPDVTGKILGQLRDKVETTAVVRPRALLDALARVAAVAEVNQSGYTLVTLTPLVEEGAIRIHARGVQAGEGTDIVYAEVTGDSDQAHLFHLGNLRSVLRTVSQGQKEDQTVTISFRKLKPALFTDAIHGYTQALFPMRPD